MDTGVENPMNAGDVDEVVMDDVIRSALRLIADVYSDRNQPIVDVRPVATGYRAFVENDEGAVTIWIDRVNGEKGTLYVADVEGPFQIRHTVSADDAALAIARAAFAARPNVNTVKRHQCWIAPQTPAYVVWRDESPQLVSVATTLSAAIRHARAGEDDDDMWYAPLMPFSTFCELAGGYGYELAAAIEAFTRYGAATLHVDREVAARLEKAATAAS
jgi:hypothetical protein